MNNYKRGLITGIPIALGYLSVSFTFGIMAVSFGLSWWQAVLISMTTVTSAGQFAGIGIMIHPGQYIQMLISQITINIRYSFMSISIGQKADSRFSGIYRWLLGFFITDEIFGMFVAVVVPEMKKARPVLTVVIIAIILSCLFYYIPLLSKISSGITITIVAITAAIIGSIFFPVSDEADNSNN